MEVNAEELRMMREDPNYKPKRPHKHAEIIKAWADGAEIQQREIGTTFWKNCYPKETHTPSFASTITEYRIKPPTVKYRVGLFLNEITGYSPTIVVTKETEKYYSSLPHFDRWLSDWQEVEV